MEQRPRYEEARRAPFDPSPAEAMRSPMRARRLPPWGDRAIDASPARPLASMLAEAWQGLNLRTRARVLGRLIASVGSLALAVVGGGAFAKYIAASIRAGEIDVSVEDAERTTPMQVYELARYVEQSDPRTFEALVHEIGRMLGGSPGPLAQPA